MVRNKVYRIASMNPITTTSGHLFSSDVWPLSKYLTLDGCLVFQCKYSNSCPNSCDVKLDVIIFVY